MKKNIKKISFIISIFPFLFFLLILLVFMGGGTSSPLATEEMQEEANNYAAIGQELGVPWDIVLMVDLIKENTSNPLDTFLEFCIIEVGQEADQQEQEEQNFMYTGKSEILGFLEFEDVPGTLAELVQRVEEKESRIVANTDYRLVMESIDLNASDIEQILAMHEKQQLAELYELENVNNNIEIANMLPDIAINTDNTNNTYSDYIQGTKAEQAVSFALSKLNYPYSQPLRDSGTHYDCSSLAYYSWKKAGVELFYQGSNTAAQEAKWCSDKGYTVSFEQMKMGDLIFYSFGSNGRYLNIGHVAIYCGNGKLVDASYSQGKVVYRNVYSTGNIVLIGRPQ